MRKARAAVVGLFSEPASNRHLSSRAHRTAALIDLASLLMQYTSVSNTAPFPVYELSRIPNLRR